MSRAVFSAADYAVVGGMLLVSGGIGAYFGLTGGRGRTADDYLMGGRAMGVLPVVLSLAATVQTAVGTLGFPGEVYLFGAALFLYPLGFTAALLLCTFVHTPVYFGMRLTSAYEYLEKRFGKIVRSVISALFIIQMVLFMSVGLYSPSIALSAVSGLSHVVSILAVGSVCAFYCTFGGMKAVLWTDVFQSVLMFLALLSVAVKGTSDVGGVSEVLRIAREGGRLAVFDTTFDPTLRFTVWSALIGGFMYGLTTCGANQTQVQRLLTLSSLKRSQLSLLISIPANLLMYYTIFTCGLVIYANFAGCDPLLQPDSSGITSADQLVPFYMVRSFGAWPGMSGFCVSGVFCAALTSISSAVNSLAAVTHQDFVDPFCRRRRDRATSSSSSAAVSKALVLFYSALCIGMTYVVGHIRAIIPAAFVVFTAIGGPTFSVITLGMVTTTANQKGVLTGLVCGIALNAWIGAGAILADVPQATLPQSVDQCPVDGLNVTTDGNFSLAAMTTALLPVTATVLPVATDTISALKEEVFPLFNLSFLLHPVPGTLLTFMLGYVVSFITGGAKDVDENLICTFMRKCLSANTVKPKTGVPDSKGNDEIYQLEHSNGIVIPKNGTFSKSQITEESKL